MQPGGEPRILRCPHCGAPLDAPVHALSTRCSYCGHTVKLGEPPAPRPTYPQPRPAAAATPAPSRLVPILVLTGAVGALGLIGVVVAFIAFQSAPRPPAAPVAPAKAAPARPEAPTPVPAKAAPAAVKRYPMRALLGINTSVDIDGSRAHLLELFPTIESERVAGDLSYTVPLSHPWFREAELRWKNERAGKLATVGFRPPLGDSKLNNQKEISECLTRGLGKPEVREIDHLAGEVSYFWGRHFPKAWANLYTGYLWLSFEDPRGVAPVTFAQVVRTLDGCVPPSP